MNNFFVSSNNKLGGVNMLIVAYKNFYLELSPGWLILISGLNYIIWKH